MQLNIEKTESTESQKVTQYFLLCLLEDQCQIKYVEKHILNY